MSARRLAAVAALCLGATWLLAPASVPLYDGVGFPDEPYRYVAPPAGAATTPAVTTATYRVTVNEGRFPETIFFFSGESGPQISILLRSTMSAPAGTTAANFTAAPLKPDVSPPSATVDGNIYRLTGLAVPSNASVTMTARSDATGKLILRATTARQGPSVYFRAAPADPWRQLQTDKVGSDTWGANPAGFGDYVLAYPDGQQDQSSGPPVALIVLGVLVLALAVAVVSVRVARRRP